MFFNKRIFNADAAVEGGAAVVDTTQTVSEPAMGGIAAAMASKGVLNTTENFGASPTNTEPAPAPATEPTVTPAAPANVTEPTPTPAATQEPTTPTDTPVFGATPPVAEPKAETVVWQEVLKQQQPDTVLKELGYDEKMVAFLNHWKTNGDVTAYLRELSTDYSKMPPEEVMRHQLRREYPKASEQALDVLYRNEIVKSYGLDPDLNTDDEILNGKMLLEVKAEKFREQLIKDQQNFLLSQPPADANNVEAAKAEQMAQEQKQRQEANEQYIQAMSASPFVKEVVSTNKFSYGEGAEKFSFPVDVNEVSGILLDGQKFYESMYEKQPGVNGKEAYTPKAEHQLLVATVAKYGRGFLDEFAKHYKALGAKATVVPIVNASEPPAGKVSMSEAAPTNAAAAMAKGGRLVG